MFRTIARFLGALTFATAGGLAERASFRDEGWWWDMATKWGATSQSGQLITRDSMLSLGPVWQAVSIIQGDVSKLPLNLYKVSTPEGDDRAIQRGDPRHWAVAHQANEEQSALQFWRQLMGDVCIYNNAFAWISYTNTGVELIPLLPDRTQPERTQAGRKFYVSEVDGKLESFLPEEILHLRGLMITDAKGRAPRLISAARHRIGIALSSIDFESKFFKNGVRTAGVLELPAGMPKTVRDRETQDFRQFVENRDNWFKVIALREGSKFHQVSHTFREAQMVQMKEEDVRDTARFYNLKPSKLGLSDSVSYNSKAEDNQDHLDTTLAHHLCMIADECEFKLLTERERREGRLYFEHNTATLLRLNLLQRFQAYEIAVNPNRGGWMRRSEVRQRENMPSMEGIDDDDPASNEGESPAGRSYGPNLERDRWLFENRQANTLIALHEQLSKKKSWRAIGPKGIKAAIRRFAEFHGLDVPQGEPGRPRRSRQENQPTA